VLVLDTVRVDRRCGVLTLVKVVLVLLALRTAASSGVELVANATEEATSTGLALALLSGNLLGATLLTLVTAGEFLDKVHG
jgi:hypothetical protein